MSKKKKKMYVIMLVFSGRRIREIYPGEPSIGKTKLWPVPKTRRILFTKCVRFLSRIFSDIKL